VYGKSQLIQIQFMLNFSKNIESYCTHPSIDVTLWLSICVQVFIFNTPEGNGLKLHTYIWKHHRRLLYKAYNSYLDFDKIMTPFELQNILHYPGPCFPIKHWELWSKLTYQYLLSLVFWCIPIPSSIKWFVSYCGGYKIINLTNLLVSVEYLHWNMLLSIYSSF
jgi:hypothetical protein